MTRTDRQSHNTSGCAEAAAAIGPDTRLDDCVIGRDCRLQHTVGQEAEVGDRALVGPYCHLPAGSHVAEGTQTGAFYTGPTD